jgi:hypothetical protein
MDLKMIKSTLDRLAELVEDWEQQGVNALERDMALEILRDVYSELRFGVKQPEPESEPEPVAVVAETVTVVEVEPVVVITEPEPDVEPESEPEKPIIPRRGVDPAVIRTLYGSEPIAPKPEPVISEFEAPKTESRPEPKPAPEVPKFQTSHPETPKPTLGDVMNEGRQTLGEVLATGRTDMASRIASAEGAPLRSSIGLNDKFLMIRDMFEGSSAAYEEAIAALDEFTDLDEAIIYIHDTYDWSADSDGVKLLIELLERKLS